MVPNLLEYLAIQDKSSILKKLQVCSKYWHSFICRKWMTLTQEYRSRYAKNTINNRNNESYSFVTRFVTFKCHVIEEIWALWYLLSSSSSSSSLSSLPSLPSSSLLLLSSLPFFFFWYQIQIYLSWSFAHGIFGHVICNGLQIRSGDNMFTIDSTSRKRPEFCELVQSPHGIPSPVSTCRHLPWRL